MSQKYKRYSLRPKEAKTSLLRVSEKLKIDLSSIVDLKSNVEVAETDFGQLFLIQGRPLFSRVGDLVLPTLLFTEVLANLPRVVVDMGAIPHVCNGADVMAPGVVRAEGKFDKGDLVLIVDVTHGKSLALGEVLQGNENFGKVKKGVVVKNMHFVGDAVWKFAKTLTA